MNIKPCAFCKKDPKESTNKSVKCVTTDCPEAETDNYTVIHTWNVRQAKIEKFLEEIRKEVLREYTKATVGK